MFRQFVGLCLKLVRLAFLSSGLQLVLNFHKHDFAELPKGNNRTALTTFPQSLMTFANCCDEFLAHDWFKIRTWNSFVKTEYWRLAITDRKIGDNVMGALPRFVF